MNAYNPEKTLKIKFNKIFSTFEKLLTTRECENKIKKNIGQWGD
jgi:hypothetical protein